MPSLKDMRKWLRGKKVDSLPSRDGVWDGERKPPPSPKIDEDANPFADEEPDEIPDDYGEVPRKKKTKLDPDAMKKRRDTRRTSRDRRFTLAADGRDATLTFGKRHRGERVSDMAGDHEGRSYLDWMLRAGRGGDDFAPFPEAICEVIRAWLRRKPRVDDDGDYGADDAEDGSSRKEKLREARRKIRAVDLDDEWDDDLPF